MWKLDLSRLFGGSPAEASDMPGIDPGNKVGGFVQWQRKYISESVFAFAIIAILGAACGVGAWLLKLSVGAVGAWVGRLCEPAGLNWLLVAAPAAAILLTALVCRWLIGYTPAHGTAQIISDLQQNRSALRPSLMWTPVATAAITLGLGGSAGSEGPVAYAGAAVGSNIGRKLGFPPDIMRVMMGCGAGAGIAAIFQSPMAGALYTIEVLRMDLKNSALMSLLMAVIIGALVSLQLEGRTMTLPAYFIFDFNWHSLLWIVLLGVFAGLYSLYYNLTVKLTAGRLERIGSPWVKNLAAGLLLGLCVMICPALYGEGMTVVGRVLGGDIATAMMQQSYWATDTGVTAVAAMCAAVLLLKGLVCALTNYGGGVAGQFTPALFAGAVAGLFFALVANRLCHAGLDPTAFTLCGIAAVMAGILRAPLMAIFLVCEMSWDFGLFLPVTLCVAVAFGVVRLFTLDRFFTSHRDRFNGFFSFINHSIASKTQQK